MPEAPAAARPVLDLLDRFRPRDEAEAVDVARVRELAEHTGDPWARANPLHLTASALIVDPAAGRVLLRWHQRQQAWLQVGGHGDPGESEPLDIARREAREESALTDLRPWPDAELWQVAVVDVPASSKEPAHQHADLRFLLATGDPDAARPETPGNPLRWLPVAEALDATTEANLRALLTRVEELFARS
ncbi:MAG TPA: NUDIX domain-containing protein [Streptosporangiaceae bacterium]|nr:NUDIX domain-containing protein [Streptosporangiaceae bacterium]